MNWKFRFGRFIYICLQKNQSFDIMKKVLLISFVILSVAAQMTHAQKQAVIKLTETTLMHEMRATPYPLDKAVVNDRAVSFQWPLRSDMNSQDSPLDGFEHKVKKVDKTKITYR